jgi:hypothetical protein
MTMKVVLKHDEENLEHAYGIDTDAFPRKMGKIIKDYLDGPNERLSSLGDHIQDTLEPNEILYLASLAVTGKLDEMEADMEQMDKIAKKLGL